MYQHGAYADILATKDFIPPKGVGTLPVYFGRLPVHQLSDYSDVINKPILVQSYQDAVNKVGYNDNNWDDFDLCEAIYAHFKNKIQTIGPIVLVNVLNPDTHKKAAQTASVTLVNSKGYIPNDKVILKSISIADKTLGIDYSVQYTSDGTRVQITDLKSSLVSPITVNFDVIDPTLVTEDDIIGGVDSTTGIRTGISVVDLVYMNYNMIPTIMCAPGWSLKPKVNLALKSASEKINGHWYAFVNSDLDTSEAGAKTIKDAKVLKNTNNHISSNEAPCWPMAKNRDKKFHISTLATVTMQWVDFNNDNVPYETPSNKPVDITGMCLQSGEDIVFDQVQANDLNSKGIRTLSFWGGRWVLWGSHTGEYEYGKEIDKKNMFDCSVRMLHYIANTFQAKYGLMVDNPMNRAMVDTILNDSQEWFDNLISQGKLLYGKIEFNEKSNPISDLIEGDFIFDLATTITPPGKSLTAKISYTAKGINVLFGGETE